MIEPSGWPEDILPNNDPAIKEVVNRYMIPCGFEAVNGRHLINEDHCIVCRLSTSDML